MKFLFTIFDGLCMAVANSVPGVSGGTIAVILGFYDNFINSLHNAFSKNKESRKEAWLFLIKLGIGWILGLGLSMLLLSKFFEKNIYFLSSVFLGLTITSIPFIIKEEWLSIKGHYLNLIFTIAGCVLVVFIAIFKNSSDATASFDFLNLKIWQYFFLILSGAVAISAMVLPGISGSTLMLILGIYLPVVYAVKEFLHFNLHVVPGLCCFGVGVILGVVLSVKFIKIALIKFRSQTLYTILGLMLGSLLAIIQGPTTISTPLPAMSLSTFKPLGFILGIVVLIALEFLKKLKEKK